MTDTDFLEIHLGRLRDRVKTVQQERDMWERRARMVGWPNTVEAETTEDLLRQIEAAEVKRDTWKVRANLLNARMMPWEDLDSMYCGQADVRR